MPIYFGLPVRVEEAYRLFDLDYDEPGDVYNQVKNINQFFQGENMKMSLHTLNKGMYVLGYVLDGLTPWDKKYYNVNYLIIKLTEYKTLYFVESAPYKENFEQVTLEHMEDEPEKVESPQPYIIEFNN